jgi:Sulfotransferase family
MLPNFFVIGAAKAATTSLHAYLGEHPQIHMSAVKEPMYFIRPTAGRPIRRQVARREDYEALFATDAPLRGESSPSYALYAWRTGVPERIHALVPHARFVYLVRDPVERTIAHYLQSVSTGRERRSAAVALGGASALDHPYGCASRYATQIEQYLPYFPLERFLVVDQADLRDDARSVLQEIYAFLGADRDFEPTGLDVVHNAAEDKRRRSRALLILRSVPGRAAFDRLPAAVREPIVAGARGVLSAPLERPELSDELREQLRELYVPEVERLRALTGKPFAKWTM